MRRPKRFPVASSVLSLPLLLALFLVSIGWQAFRGPTPAEDLARGVELLENGDLEEAEELLLLAAEHGDAEVRRVAFHDLGWLKLAASETGSGAAARAAASDAVSYGEAALRIASSPDLAARPPGVAGTARNLELALRRLSELEREMEADRPRATATVDEPSPGPGSDQPKILRTPADTEREGMRPGAVPSPERSSPSPGMSETEARRILASFRLLENEASARVIRSRLGQRSSTSRSASRRGPPW